MEHDYGAHTLVNGSISAACFFALILSIATAVNAEGTDPGQMAPQNVKRPLFHVTPWRPMPAATIGPVVPTSPAAPPSLSTTAWTSIGPAPLSTTAMPNANTNVSGRITGIAPHPGNANVIYVATAGGGVWKTTNGGTNWTPLTDGQTTLSMGAIAVAAGNPNMIYAGTGEANNSFDSNAGKGILVSTDGGANWTLQTAGGAFDGQSTSKIVTDPSDPNGKIAYAAMSSFGTNAGIWKTVDGGATWVNTTTSITPAFFWSDIAIAPKTPSTLYAAVGDSSGSASNGVYKSIDGGNNWTLLSNAPSGTATGRISIAVAKSNPQVVYVSVSANGNDLSSTVLGGLYKFMRSDNGGSTFTDLTSATPNYMGGQGAYDTTLIVDPTNAAIVYAGGQAGVNSIIRSTTSGGAWADISTGGAPNFTSPHVDHHAASFDANGKLLDGDDGGIYRLDDPTVPSWSDLNGDLGTIQFMGIGLHPTNPSIAIGGSQDNGTELFSGDTVWTETDGGDGGFAKFSQTNGRRVYHQLPNGNFGTNFFRRSDDGGNTWTTKTAGISVDVNNQNFYAPFVVDPGNGDRVLYGTNRIWETTDGGDSWATISNVGTAGFNNNGFNVDAIGLAPSDPNTIYAVAGGQTFVTTNHGLTWTMTLGIGGGVNEIQVDPGNAQVAYAVANNPNSQVYKTTNGGGSWTNITGNLPSQRVWSLQVVPLSNTLFAGADDGVYVTTNGGTTWGRFGMGLPNAQVFQIELNSTLHILGAATHGRGMWEISTAPNTTMQVAIAIKPGNRLPSINPRSAGKTPVAILSSPAFNAVTEVDRSSLTFGETGSEPTLISCNPGGEDVNGDGLPDLVCRFRTNLTGFVDGDTTGVLKGKTTAGVVIRGAGTLKIVP